MLGAAERTTTVASAVAAWIKYIFLETSVPGEPRSLALPPLVRWHWQHERSPALSLATIGAMFDDGIAIKNGFNEEEERKDIE